MRHNFHSATRVVFEVPMSTSQSTWKPHYLILDYFAHPNIISNIFPTNLNHINDYKDNLKLIFDFVNAILLC